MVLQLFEGITRNLGFSTGRQISESLAKISTFRHV